VRYKYSFSPKPETYLSSERQRQNLRVYYILFFYWHYNPLRVLTFSVILFHSALSLHCFLYRLISIICISSSISTIHLFLGLPLILIPIGFHSNILLGVLLSSFSVTLFHSALSLHCFLYRLIPIICISSSISTIHLFLGLPLILVPIAFHSNIL